MAVKLGTTSLGALYLGSTAISTAYLGSVQVYSTGGAFTPAALFASGEEGAWYEPSTTTAFLSTTDLTPCDYGQSCGFLLDKSQGAGYSGGAFTGLSATENVTNGTFDSNITGWTNGLAASSSWSSGEIFVTGGGQFGVYQQLSGLTIGSTYYLSADGRVGTGTDVRVRITSDTNLLTTRADSNVVTATGSNEQMSLTFVAQETNPVVYLRTSGIGDTGYFDNISVKELPGNHATQSSEPARPILARVPPRGRVNELSETDTLATQSVTVTAAQRTLSFTGTGTVTLTGASTAGPLVGTGAGDRVSLTFTPSAGTLTLTVLGTVTDAQLELGASATTYQSVADSLGYDITEAGVTSIDYLFDDEADDAISWTAPADTDYTIARVDTSGSVTILTGQSLSGATDILLEQDTVGYVAVDRALTSQETTDLTAYLEALA